MLFLLLLLSCHQHLSKERKEIMRLISSNTAIEIVEGYYWVGETKDTFFVKDIFIEPADPRISHHLNFKGMSVYQAKMGAMRKITGVDPPAQITNKPDTALINFYLQVAKEKQLLR